VAFAGLTHILASKRSPRAEDPAESVKMAEVRQAAPDSCSLLVGSYLFGLPALAPRAASGAPSGQCLLSAQSSANQEAGCACRLHPFFS
jgi:hypothetical protein